MLRGSSRTRCGDQGKGPVRLLAPEMACVSGVLASASEGLQPIVIKEAGRTSVLYLPLSQVQSTQSSCQLPAIF